MAPLLLETGLFYRVAIFGQATRGDFDAVGNVSTMKAIDARLVHLPRLLIPSEVGDFVRVMVTYVEKSDRVFVQLREESQTISVINELMGRLYSNIEARDFDLLTPTRGYLCAARSKDGSWLRACVIEHTTKRSIKVFLLDYGTTESVRIEDVKQLDLRLISIPPQAILVHICIENSPRDSQRLRQILEKRYVRIKFDSVAKDDSSLLVVMCTDDSGKDVFINEVTDNTSLPANVSSASVFAPDNPNAPTQMGTPVLISQTNGASSTVGGVPDSGPASEAVQGRQDRPANQNRGGLSQNGEGSRITGIRICITGSRKKLGELADRREPSAAFKQLVTYFNNKS